MLSIEISNNTTHKLGVAGLVAVVIPIIALGRCLFFSNKISMVASLCVLALALLAYGFKFEAIDCLVTLSVLLMLLHKTDKYAFYLCGYGVLAAVAFLFFKCKKATNSLRILLNTMAVFSLINMAVSIINFMNPDLYFNIINFLLLPDMAEDAKFYYEAWGHICGLSDHYSRNAYFCVLGCMIFFAKFLAEDKHRKTYFIIGVTEFALLVCLGKRGHLLFMVAATTFVYLWMEPKLSKKLTRLLKLIVILCVALAIIIEFVPTSVIDFSTIFTHDAKDISTGRFALWSRAISLFKENVLFGKGYGYFTANTINSTINLNYAGVHNDYLQWLCEEGIIGFLINMMIMILAFIMGLRMLKYSLRKTILLDAKEKTALIWAVLFQTFVIMYSMTGLPHFDYEINIIYYIAMAIPYSIAGCKNVCLHQSARFKGLLMR